MELDAKQQVLIAFYTEYQKDLPGIKTISPETLNMEYEVFNNAVLKLQNEELIHGATIKNGSKVHASIRNALPTSKGLDYVESKLEINRELTNVDKVKATIAKTGEWGFAQLKDVGSKVLAELIKKQFT